MSQVDFWSEDLQQCIQTAGQQGKTLLCFVYDDSEDSEMWEKIISSQQFRPTIQDSTIRLRLRQSSQEFAFLNGVCPLSSTPAIVLIRGGQIEEKLEASNTSFQQLQTKLAERYISESDNEDEEPVDQCLEFAPSTGRMRLPNNAYDTLKEQTEKLQQHNISAKNILALQLRSLEKIPSMKAYVAKIRARTTNEALKLPEEAINRLLNTPASSLESPSPAGAAQSGSTPVTTLTPSSSTEPSPPPESAPISDPTPSSASSQPQPSQNNSQSNPSTQKVDADLVDYRRQQREREAAQRAERDRIKAQIKADREERRRLDALRKQGEQPESMDSDISGQSTQRTKANISNSNREIRLQVRTFDGSTLRTTFPSSATVTNDVRPWIDQTNPDAKKSPYNLKLILTPLPNRNIEASEEEKALPELGIVGSATLVMVPVAGFVDSYAGASTGIAGSVIGGLMGAGGSVVSGVLGMLGWGSSGTPPANQQTEAAGTAQRESEATAGPVGGSSSSGSNVKVRTLMDQREDEQRRRGNQLYNGNSLDFQGRKDDDDNRKED